LIVRRRATAAGVVLVALVAAGCTSRPRDAASSSTPSAPAPTSSAAPASTPPAPTTPAPSSAPSTPVPSTGSSTPTTPAPPPSPVAHSTCTAVTVRVIRGSADHGREFAALQFTNDAGTRCRLEGYPTVTLRKQGKTIGTPSQPATSAASARDLAAGDTAESLLTDYTNCQAPLSDEIQVVVPGSTITAVRPAQLRACTLRVAGLTAEE
jgi:hypothetical protein